MPASKALSVPTTYADLRRAVEVAMVQGQQAVEQAKVRTYHETGRLIADHLDLHADEPNYGTKTMLRLAADLKVNDSVLYRCVRFVECFPILATRPKLTWAHYRTLIPVEDEPRRKALAKQADREEWTVAQLEQRVRALAPPEPADDSVPLENAKSPPLVAKRGTVGVYRIVARGEGPAQSGVEGVAVDLGFKLYLPIDAAQGRPIAEGKAGDYVRIDGKGRVTPAPDATKADLFTYAATVRRVIDGDTLAIEVALPTGIVLEEKLRLRALDCPEMDTPEGQAAKRFTAGLVQRAVAVTITTTKPDKYDRYLSDVYLQPAEGEEVFLNNALLAAGHAVRKDSYAPVDWGE